VLDGVLHVRHPAAVVITETPSPLEATPPLATVLDQHRTGWVVAVLPEQSDDGTHTSDLPQSGRNLVQAFE